MNFNNDFTSKAAFFGAIAAAVASVLSASPAEATDRHFTYTYESAGLPRGASEIEVWATSRVGRDHFYNRFDNRIELEYGVTDRLLTAFYVQSLALAEADGGEHNSKLEFAGVSSEWKLKLSDSVAHALGSALYAEFTYAPDAIEAEAKVIVDKRAGAMLVALNGVYELEVENLSADKGVHDGEKVIDHVVEADLAAAYFFNPHVSLGLEARGHGIFGGKHFESMALFAGPALGVAGRGMWASLSVLGQLGALHGSSDVVVEVGAPPPARGFAQDFRDHEKVNARLLMGFHL